MPANIPAFTLHTSDALQKFGLPSEPDPLWLHSVTDSARRERMTIMDENLGVAIMESFINASATYAIDAHTRGQRGIANYHPGQSVDAAIIPAALSDLPFQFHSGNGLFIYDSPVRTREAASFHRLTFNLLHIFPEGNAFSSLLNIPSTQPEIVIDSPTTGGGIDTGTRLETLRVLRIEVSFTPARGRPESGANYTITRLLSSRTTPTLAEIYSWGNPPGPTWQTTPAGAAVDQGPAYSATDSLAGAASTVPGTCEIIGIYELNSDSNLLNSVSNPYDSAAHGTDVILIVLLDGTTRQLIIGDFPNQAAVLTELGLANTSTLSIIWNATTGTFYFGTAFALSDPLDYWRIARAQSTTGRALQLYEIMGHRTPSGKYRFVRVSPNNFDPDNAYLSASYPLPAPPPARRWNLTSATSTNDLLDIDVVYNYNTATYDVGDAAAVTALSETAPVAGQDLWIFKYKTLTNSTFSEKWDYRIGNLATATALWNAEGHSGAFNGPTQTLYDVLYHANNNSYAHGSAANGDPFLSTTGISLY